MINVIVTGVVAEYNFGSPSILHGMEELLKILFKDEFRIVDFQKTKVVPEYNSDFNFPIYQSRKTVKQLLVSLIREKISLGFDKSTDFMIETIKQADIVIDLFGICFCDNFNKKKYLPHKAFTHSIGRFAPLFIAKSYGVKSAKNTSSFGPMKYKINSKSAYFASERIFDVIIAREQQSRMALIEDAKVKKEILVSPDIANLMRYEKRNTHIRQIGISTSHQIIKQWGAEDSYIDCIVTLCLHIEKEYHIPVVLIPNEYNPNQSYNDVTVSNEIKSRLKNNDVSVEVLDVLNMNSSQIKNAIAECNVLVASRYHSCVAALSASVPTLILGWHYKYEELLKWYNQSQWIISNKDCNAERLITMFDAFWLQRDQSKQIIRQQYPKVRQAVIEIGKKMFFSCDE